MTVTAQNRARWRAILISRDTKWLLTTIPDRVRGWLVAWLWRWLFASDEGALHRAGEIILADLRDHAKFSEPLPLDIDPLAMARIEGRRETVRRILNYLNLDEAVVGEIMELDDGLGQ